MVEPARRFDVVSSDDDETSQQPKQTDVAVNMMLMALQALSKRTIIALESCFSLITVGLVFIAAYPILTSAPTVNQLVGLGSLSIFVLIANYFVLKRRG